MKNAAVIYLSKWSKTSDTYKTLRGALVRVVAALTDNESDNDVDPEKFPWHELRYEDVRSVAAEMIDEYAPRTVNLSLSALRGVLETAWRADMLPDDVYRKIDIANVAGDSEQTGRALTSDEMSALCAALHNTDARDAAVMALLAGAGIRRVELVRLRGHDFERANGRLTVRGKGNKHRQIPVGERWQKYITNWQAQLSSSAALMFEFENKDSRKAISYIVEKFRKALGVPLFTPHDLRRTFITHVEKTAGMALAKQLAGHSHMQTTALYVHIDEERERAAVKDL